MESHQRYKTRLVYFLSQMAFIQKKILTCLVANKSKATDRGVSGEPHCAMTAHVNRKK